MIPEQITALRNPANLLAVGLAAVAIVLHYTGLEAILSYQRSLIANGSWWLLLSGNFVHLGSSHLWMNLAGLALVAALVWRHFNAWQWSILIILSSLGVGVGLWFFNPEVEGYVGFSGTLHGLIIAGALADLRVYPRTAAILLLCIVAKLAWEQLSGALPGSESVAGGKVLVDAHLYGAIAGALIAAFILLYAHHQTILTQKPR
jgi:rhomboid family GlyGly-CTERM serine protease